MAEIKTNLRTYLVAQSAVTDVFSTRIYVDHVPPDAALPYARIINITENPTYTHDNKPTRKALLQIDIYDDSIVDCITARDAIKGVLSGYSGTMGSLTVGFVFVNSVLQSWNTDTDQPREILEVLIGTSNA